MEKAKTKKILRIVLSVILAVLVVLGAVALWLFLPRKGEASKEMWFSGDTYDASAVQTIEKTPGEAFKILQLTDIQIGFPSQLAEAKDRIKEAVDKSQPDLIVLTGDNIEGPLVGVMLKPLASYIDSFGIPWAPVYGNHDGEFGFDLNWQGDLYESYEHCLFQKGPVTLSGVGNYAVNLTENGKIVYSLILLDSGSGRTYPDGKWDYDYIKEDQIHWYEWNIRGVSNAAYGTFDPAAGKVVPSMCFFHIPLPEYATAMQGYVDSDGKGKPQAEGAIGENRENVCCPPVNSGFFARAKALGSTTAFVAGHDHVNSSVLQYEGITLAYGLKATRGNYHDNDMLGSSVITISADCKSVSFQHNPSDIPVK